MIMTQILGKELRYDYIQENLLDQNLFQIARNAIQKKVSFN